MVATFDADMVPIREENLKALGINDMEGIDMVLGPRSDPEVMGEQITTAIVEKGIAVCKLFVSPEDLQSMVATAEKAVADDSFVRLPAELETGYLGREGTGKTMSLDMEDEELEDYIRDSDLKIVEDTFSTVGMLLRPYTGDKLGHGIHSRSNTMLVLPFDGDDSEFPPPDFANDEAAHFLQTMYRAKLLVLANVGPASGTLTLIPKSEGMSEQKFVIPPGTLVIMSTEYKYAFVSEGKALTMRCWYLDEPTVYEIKQHPDADLANLVDLAPQARKGSSAPRGDPVAVAAIAGRYTYGVDCWEKLWTIWRHAAIDAHTKHPYTRWECDDYYMENATPESGLSYTCHATFTDGIELFDNKFFDMSPQESRAVDPTQRQVLEVSYLSLSEAGFHKKQLMSKPQQIAVFVGIDKNEWAMVPKDGSAAFGASGSANAITSNRFSYVMNLKGASMTIDTACSASLVCAHTAKLYLLHKQWDPCVAAITCGVNLIMSPFSFTGACGAGMLSHKGRCFTYNHSADGYARGESVGSHCIKNEAWDHKEKGHYAMVSGSQVNQDGRSASLTAPNGPSQEKCNAAVLREAGLRPSEVDTTECHGTGTSLGDPIEIGAYQKVLGTEVRPEPVMITSNKSNIGHCEGSAGVSGFIKCVLMALHCEATPNVHLNFLNPHLDMSGFPGIIMGEANVMRFDSSNNGVLSFGFGGTNACVQIWGQNLMTSRAAGTKDLFKTLIDKIQKAPPQQVTITSENWEDWEMDGPAKNVRDQSWDIAVMADGTVQYLERPEEIKDLGTYYSVISSGSGWQHDAMEQDDMLEGLYSTTITLGPSGEERFQVVADEDEEMVFYPATSNCHWKSTEVRGPEKASTDKSWCIQGFAGDTYRIEFCKSAKDKVSVMWFKEQ
jgi:polyketide synthase-associated protein